MSAKGLNNVLSRRAFIIAAAAILPTGVNALGYESAETNAQIPDAEKAEPSDSTFSISKTGSPVTGLVFWKTKGQDAALQLAARLLDLKVWHDGKFVAAALYCALDGQRVVLYGQWTSKADCVNAFASLALDTHPKPDAEIFDVAATLPTQRVTNVRPRGLALFRELQTEPAQQKDLLSRELDAAAIETKDNPDVSTVNLHRGTEGQRIVTFVQIADAAAARVRERGFDARSRESCNDSGSECRVYDTVFVMTAER